MNSIEFDESQLEDLQTLGQALFQSPQDPRSIFYQRVLERPKISWWSVALHCPIPPLVAVLLGLGLRALEVPPVWSIGGPVLALAVYGLLRLKALAIGAVRLYQHFAPEALRRKCRFEPSCSQYMILSLEKYGAFRGLARGIGRLRRCNKDHGGFDAP